MIDSLDLYHSSSGVGSGDNSIDTEPFWDSDDNIMTSIAQAQTKDDAGMFSYFGVVIDFAKDYPIRIDALGIQFTFLEFWVSVTILTLLVNDLLRRVLGFVREDWG